MTGAGARRSAFWSRWFPVQYRVIRWLDPLVRAWWSRAGLGDTAELLVVGRRTGRPRRVLVGLLEVGGRWYVGHPNGAVAWTRNLEAAGAGAVRQAASSPVDVVARPLPPGPERSSAILATFVQHPFPGNVIYRLAGRHIEAVGAFFLLEPLAGPEQAGPEQRLAGLERPLAGPHASLEGQERRARTPQPTAAGSDAPLDPRV